MRTVLRSCLAIVIATTITLAGRAAAQGTTTGAIAGHITDSTGTGIPDVQVTVTNRNTGFTIHTVTRTNGQYFVQGLEVGNTFRVATHRIGFAAQAKDVNNVVLEQVTPIDFILLPEIVTLSTVRTQAQPTTAVSEAARNGVGTVIDRREIESLPSLDRNFTDFVALTPEISATNELGGFSAAGENPHYNSIQIDGATEADLFGLGSTGQAGGQAHAKSIPIESISQYQVLISPYDVRDGQFSGALINAITKSGTNDFHGSAYYFYRNQAIGRSQPYLPNYNESQYGFSLGGPIIRNKIFFFVNPEFQTEASPAPGGTAANLSAGAQADLAQFTQLASQYGFATGSAGAVTNRHPLSNLFARLDFNLPFNSTLVLRNNYAHADEDAFERSVTSFSLTSQNYTYESTKNATTAELRSNFANGAYNELIATYELIRDNRPGASHSPQLEVIDPTYNVDFYTGTEYASQGNSLNQDLIEIRDNVTVPIGDHSITLGTQDQFYKVRNFFAEYSYSAWTFEGLDSLQAGLAHSYRIGVPAPDGGAVQFHTDNLSFYAEDQWQATPRFELTYGIRFDIPVWLDKPPYNASLDTSSVGNINNSNLPSGQIQFSPRVGFNYDVTADHNNPVHGGVGVFSGPPAYVWLSNSFQNSGYIGYNQLTCNNAAKVAPTLSNGTVANPPSTCANGVGAASGGEIDYTDKNFKYPQDLKASLGYDPHLPWGLTAHASYLFTHAIYAPIFQNAALAGPVATGPWGNAIYGPTPNNAALNIPGRTEIFELTNTNKNWSYDITGGISKRFSHALLADIYYTYSQARDVQSITSTTSASSYTYSWSPYWNQSQQRLGISNFQTPNKITADLTYEMPWHTIIAATYIGTSGQPYTLTYGFDANGDGISGNDPIYVPKSVTDPTQIQFAPIKNGLTVTQQQQLLQTFLNENPCLARQEGHYMARNSCSTPWQNTMNVSLQQAVHFLHTQQVTLHCEVFNFLNLLSKNWGQIYEGEGSETLFNQPSSGPTVSGGATPTTQGNLTKGGLPIVNFTSLNNPGKVLDPVNSNWQMQFGIRYAF